MTRAPTWVHTQTFLLGLAEVCHGRLAKDSAITMRAYQLEKIGSIVDGAAVAQGALIMAMKASEIGIKTPCTLDWTKMTPAQGGRFCGDCKKVVRDLSKMTEAEARALVEKERYEGLCVRMLVDRDGNVFYGGDRLVSASLLSKAKRAAVAAAAIALPLATNACSALGEPLGFSDQEQTDDYEEMMGGMEAPRDQDQTLPVDVDASADAQKADAQNADAGNDPQADGGADAAPDVIIYK